jgi:hydrogenase maturation protease
MNESNEAIERPSMATADGLGKTVILGVGNVLLSDEGVGIHVVQELMKMALPPTVEVIEGGTGGFGLLDIVTEADRLIVIDAVKGDGEPGTIYLFNFKDAPDFPDGYKTSVHQVGILEVVRLAGLIGKTPETTIIGVEPKSLETGMILSSEVRAKIPRIIELVHSQLSL